MHPKVESKSDTFTPSFDWLNQLADATLAEFQEWLESNTSEAKQAFIRETMQRVARNQLRRAIPTAESSMLSGDPVFDWCVKLFLSFRDQSAMIDYLRMQECAFQTIGAPDPLDDLSAGITEGFAGLGRKDVFQVRLGVILSRSLRISKLLSLDPFPHIRRIYRRILRAKRKQQHSPGVFGRILNRIDVAVAKFKIQAVIHGGIWYASRALKWLQSEPEFIPSDIERHVVGSIREMFRAEVELGTVDELDLLERCYQYVVATLPGLADAMWDSYTEQSASKFLKVFIGVLIGRMSERPPTLTTQYIVDTFKAAFCWASTYPLVDDVLDSGNTSNSTRADLAAIINNVFGNGESVGQTVDKSCVELRQRMVELKTLIPSGHETAAAQSILNVFRAHQQDAGIRESEVNVQSYERLRTALLKALLVRAATMHVCGIFPSKKDYEEMAIVAVFNQLGDDIWDAIEDIAEGRTTLVTNQLLRGGPNAYEYYLQYAGFLVSKFGVVAARPACLAIAHTFRLAWDAGTTETRQALTEALSKFSPNLDQTAFFRHTQYIDPDALIFDLEAALGSLVDESWDPAYETDVATMISEWNRKRP